MLGIFIGLLGIAESIRPGIQLPKILVLPPFLLSLAVDILLIVKLLPHFHFSV